MTQASWHRTSYDPSRSNDMMRNIYRVSSQIAESCSPQSPLGRGEFRPYRSDVPLDGLITPPRPYPARRALATSTRQLDPGNRSQYSETSIPPTPDSIAQNDTSIADYVGDESRNERACNKKSKLQLASDAESKQKQINQVFMNLKIAEKVSFCMSKNYAVGTHGFMHLWPCRFTNNRELIK